MNKIERKQEVLIVATQMINCISDRMNNCFKYQTDVDGNYVHDSECSWKLLKTSEFESQYEEEVYETLQYFRDAFETFVLKY